MNSGMLGDAKKNIAKTMANSQCGWNGEQSRNGNRSMHPRSAT